MGQLDRILLKDIFNSKLTNYNNLIENCNSVSKKKLSFKKQNMKLIKFITND